MVIPAKCQDALLKELHESHPGISRMKSLARSHISWPKMDADIELCIASMVMAREALVPSTHGLCRPYPGQVDFSDCQRSQ